MREIDVQPLQSFHKTVEAAPDKSITHRAVMLNAFAYGKAQIHNALLGEDCLATVDCMQKIGAEIWVNGSNITVKGIGDAYAKSARKAMLYVGNSGTTVRLLSGLLSGLVGSAFTLDGDETIRRRPMGRVIEPLRLMGAKIDSADGKAPLTVFGAPLSGIRYMLPVASAQVKSAVLLAGLSAEGETTVVENDATRDHTERMLHLLGADIEVKDNATTVKKSRLSACSVTVPGDISSAAYPLVLAACLKGANVTVKNVGVNSTRTGLLDVFDACGVAYKLQGGTQGFSTQSAQNYAWEPTADVSVSHSAIRPFTIGGKLIPRLIDEIPILAVMACFAEGTSVITGAAELKVKESNRIDTTVKLIRAFGGEAEATADGMLIHGKGFLRGGCTVDPLYDHRIAMSAAIAAACSQQGAKILNPDCATVSYPGFYELLGNQEECL